MQLNNPKILVLLTILFWSLCILLTRIVSQEVPLLNMSVLLFFTFLFFLVYNIFYYKKLLLRKILHIKLAFFLFGLFGFFLYYLGLVESFSSFNSASETAILNYTFPIFTIIFTDVLFNSPYPRTFIVSLMEYSGVIIGFISVIISATHGKLIPLQVTNIKGILWGLLAGSSYGVFSAYSSGVSQEDQPIFLLSAAFGSFIFSLFVSMDQLHLLTKLSPTNYLLQAILAFIVNGLGYITWIRAQRLANILCIPISSIASLMFVLPLIALTMISLFLKETELFKPYFFISVLLLLISTYLCQKSKSIYALFV